MSTYRLRSNVSFMTVFRPWDADDDEYTQRLEIKEQIPPTLRPALLAWLRNELATAPNYSSERRTWESTVLNIQSALAVNLDQRAGTVLTKNLVSAIAQRGDKFLLRVVDFLLSMMRPERSNPGWPTEPPTAVTKLIWHLDQNMSAVTVVEGEDGSYRIARRLPLGVEESGVSAVDSASEAAGRHLTKAWMSVRSLTPDTSLAMTEAIRAVEAAAAPVVLPKDKRQQLSKIVQALKERKSWTLVLEQRDDGYPNQHLVLIGMLETLVFAQQSRHGGGEPPSLLQALSHVQLASTLVAWFATGAVVNESQT